jgi:hypothetical protein
LGGKIYPPPIMVKNSKYQFDSYAGFG